MKNEEAHVSRKKLKHGEKVELLVKVELVSSTFSSLISIFVFNYLDKVEFWLHQQTNYTCCHLCRHYHIIFFLFTAFMQPHQTQNFRRLLI